MVDPKEKKKRKKGCSAIFKGHQFLIGLILNDNFFHYSWQDSDAKMYNTTTTGKIEKKLCVLIWILPSNISLPTRILSRLSPCGVTLVTNDDL